MTKLDQYLANAEHCRELLRATRDPRHRVYLLEMLATWEMLVRAAKSPPTCHTPTTSPGGEAHA